MSPLFFLRFTYNTCTEFIVLWWNRIWILCRWQKEFSWFVGMVHHLR